MRHSRVSLFITAATFVAGLGGVAAASVGSTSASKPAASHRGADAAPPSQSVGATTGGRSVTPVTAATPASTVAPASATPASHDAAGRTAPAPPASHDAAGRTAPAPPATDRERLRLHCAGFASRDVRPGVKCSWSASKAPRFAGYRLVRGDGDHRAVVFQARDRSHTSFVDHKVEPGVTYTYVVLVVDRAGEVIGRSEPVTVGWRSEKPSPDVVAR